MLFCVDNCPACLFLRQSWDTWSFQTLKDSPRQCWRQILWSELVNVGVRVNNGNYQEFLVHLAQKYHLHLLSFEDSFLKEETKESFEREDPVGKNTDGFSKDHANVLPLSSEEYKMFAIQVMGELHICLLQRGYLSRWLLEMYRLVRILKLVQASFDNTSAEANTNNKEISRYGMWDLLLVCPEIMKRYVCYILNRLSMIMCHGMEQEMSVALFSFMKAEKEFTCQYRPTCHHFIGKESTTLLQKLIFEDSETIYSPGTMSSSQYTHRPRFINLEQNWDRLTVCFRKWNGEIRDGNAGILDVCIVHNIFEELLPDNLEAFTRRWLHMLLKECIHEEEQTLANIQKLGVGAASLERVHHLQSRMNPFTTNQRKSLHGHLERGYSYLFRGKERFFMEMIESADCSSWNSCLIQLVHRMIENIIEQLDKLSLYESEECDVFSQEQCIVDCVLYGRLATKILALLLTLTGPHETPRNSSRHSKTRRRSYTDRKHTTFQKKEMEAESNRRISSDVDHGEAESLVYFLRNLHFDNQTQLSNPSYSFISIASNYWLLYTNCLTYLKYAMQLFPSRFSFALSLFIMWTPYLAIAGGDEIISQTPWFTQCITWIRQWREELYDCFLDTKLEHESNPEIYIHGWTLMLSVIEEQIPLARIPCWWKQPNNVSLCETHIKEYFLGGDSRYHEPKKQISWWMDKRLFWHCLPHMKQLHRLVHDWDEIRQDTDHSKLTVGLSTVHHSGTSRRIQPSLAIVSKGNGYLENDKSYAKKKCFPHPIQYAEQLEPIQQLIQKVFEKKMYFVLENLDASETEDAWWQSTGSYWVRAYHVCLHLYMCNVKDLLRNLEVPLDTIYRAVDETYCKTIQPWIRTRNQTPLLILQRVKASTDKNLYHLQETLRNQNEMPNNDFSESKATDSSSYLQVYQQLIEENPIATRLENFLIQQLQCIIDIDSETYSKLGVYQLEQNWLQWISILLESCVSIEGERASFPKLTEWLWKHLSLDPIHPMVQSTLALVLSKAQKQ